jgi:dTMP kinase
VRGSLIAIEGIGGSGKTTLANDLARWLAEAGVRVVQTKEPGGTSAGTHLRDLLLSAEYDLAAWTEAFLFEADRCETYAKVVLPALEDGRVVISDRNLYGTIAYQGFGSGLAVEQIDQLTTLATAGVYPDRVLLLDLEPSVAVNRVRVQGASDKFDKLGPAYQARVRAGYLFAAGRDPGIAEVLDAALPAEVVTETAQIVIGRHLATRFPHLAPNSNPNVS